MIRRLFHGIDRLMLVFALAGMGVLGVAIVVVIADILMRHTISESIMGTVDITQLCVMACAFWAIPLAFTRAGHVSVELGTDRLPPRVRHALDGLAALLGAVFVGMIGWYGKDSALMALDYGDLSQTIGIPMIWYWATLLSGAALSLLATLAVAARHFTLAVAPPDGDWSENQAGEAW